MKVTLESKYNIGKIIERLPQITWYTSGHSEVIGIHFDHNIGQFMYLCEFENGERRLFREGDI